MKTSQGSVLIIGAGIIGIACAHFLSQQNYKVTVIDKGRIAGGCSHGNCGHILPSHVQALNSPLALKMGFSSFLNPKAPLSIGLRLEADILNWLWQFALKSFGTHPHHVAKSLSPLLASSRLSYTELMADIALNCDWNPSGLLYLFKSNRVLKAFSKTNDWLASNYNIKAEALNPQSLNAYDNSISKDLAGGFFYAQDASLRPDLLTQNWANFLKTKDVVFFEKCEFKALKKKNNTITHIHTNRGEFQADHIVIAAGALSGAFAKELDCAIPLQPGKGYSVTFEHPSAPATPSIILPEKSLALTSFQDSLRIGAMMELTGFNDELPPQRITQLRHDAQPYFKTPLNGREQERWFGWRPMTWDSLPIIGRVPLLNNAYLATGHNMIGMMSAPATGQLIAEMIIQKKPHIACDAFAPHRFNSYQK